MTEREATLTARDQRSAQVAGLLSFQRRYRMLYVLLVILVLVILVAAVRRL